MSKLKVILNIKDLPFLSNAIKTGLLMGAGDLMAQICIEKKSLGSSDNNLYSFQRTAKFSFLGFALTGPALTIWYSALDKMFDAKSSKRVVLKKVACDQLIMAPLFLPLFLVSVGFLNRKPWTIIKEDLRRDYPDILKANYMVFPAVQFINFYFVPLKHQVLLIQVVALFWNTYLSWKTQAKH